MHILPGTETKKGTEYQASQSPVPTPPGQVPGPGPKQARPHPNPQPTASDKRRLPPRPSHVPHPTSNILVHTHPFTGQAGQPYIATVAVAVTAFCRQMGGYDIPPGRVGGRDARQPTHPTFSPAVPSRGRSRNGVPLSLGESIGNIVSGRTRAPVTRKPNNEVAQVQEVNMSGNS